MSLSLKEILAAKKAAIPIFGIEEETLVDEDEDLFSLTSSSAVTSEVSLRVFLTLVHVSAHRSNLLANDNEGLKILARWLGPFNSFHLPYDDKIPKFLQSYMLWQIGIVTKIPPAKLWGEILSIIVESHEKSA